MKIVWLLVMLLLSPALSEAAFETFSDSGGDAASTGYLLRNTAGQASALGESSSSNYINRSGFWYAVAALQTLTKPGDCDNSGSVTIDEVQSAINMFLGLKTVAGCVDNSGDGTVDISEVQKVINGFLGL